MALRELAAGERDARRQLSSATWLGGRRRGASELGEGAREEQVAHRDRAVAPERAETVGRPRRSGAPSSTSSCTRVAMWTSSIEVDRIKAKARGGEWLFRCEHCRRLLVVR